MKEFNWTSHDIGLSLAFVGLIIAIVQGGLNRIINPILGDRKSVILGTLFYAIGFGLFAFASQGWMMYAIMIPFGMGGIAGPSLQSIISQQVSPSEQGELQGALTSLQSITTIIGPLIASNLFAYFTSETAPIHFPGAAFFMGSILTFISLFIAIRSFPSDKNKPNVA
jgi:DHA1 family tetracycline resistance protein-like MFS transporter